MKVLMPVMWIWEQKYDPVLAEADRAIKFADQVIKRTDKIIGDYNRWKQNKENYSAKPSP